MRVIEKSLQILCVIRYFTVGCTRQPTAIQGSNLVRLLLHRINTLIRKHFRYQFNNNISLKQSCQIAVAPH